MTPPTCTCGAPAAHQTPVGRVLRGSRWVRVWAWLCPECNDEAMREREIARSA